MLADRQTDRHTHTQTCSLQYFATAPADEVIRLNLARGERCREPDGVRHTEPSSPSTGHPSCRYVTTEHAADYDITFYINLYSSSDQKCVFSQLLSLFIVLISYIILRTDYQSINQSIFI